MAESAITIGLETVQDLLREEPPFLLGVRDEVEEIGKELERMKPFLEHISTKEYEELNEEIRKVAEEVDDVLKKFAKEVKKRRSRIYLKRLACFFNDHISFRKKRSEVISAKKNITNLSRAFEFYAARPALDSALERRRRLLRRTYPLFDEDDATPTVGMEEDIISELVFQLVNNNEETSQCCQVVSICGMGGVGKTTLAKKIYKHAEVRRCFNLFSWTCVGQTQERRDTLMEIFLGLKPEMKEEFVRGMTERELLDRIYQVQQENKCLIVIDDIWTIGSWNILRVAFPTGKSKTGSKVLLTTRNKKVALHADPSGYLHEVNFLTEEESWDLLQRTLNRNNERG